MEVYFGILAPLLLLLCFWIWMQRANRKLQLNPLLLYNALRSRISTAEPSPEGETGEEIVDWFLQRDDQLQKLLKPLQDYLPALKEEILLELKLLDSPTRLKKHLEQLSWLLYLLSGEEETVRTGAKEGPQEEVRDSLRFLLYQRFWIFAKFKIEGYLLQHRYNIDSKEIHKHPPDFKEQLQEFYVDRFNNELGMPQREAERTFEEVFDRVLEEAIEEGTLALSPLYGDLLLAREESNPELLQEKRREGVSDADIRSWWNRLDIMRRMAVREDELRILRSYEHARERGFSTREAEEQIRSYYPIYDEYFSSFDGAPENKPLPWELKGRVDAYFNHQMTESQTFAARLESAPSCNAFLREELEKGNL